MIKAVLKAGVIFPQSSLPGDWKEGEALIVEAERDLSAATEPFEPLEPMPEEELQAMLAAVNEHRCQQKLRMAESDSGEA